MKEVTVVITLKCQYPDETSREIMEDQAQGIIEDAKELAMLGWRLKHTAIEVPTRGSETGTETEYDGPPATNDDPEHIKELASRVNYFRMSRIADKLFDVMYPRLTVMFIGDENFATMVGSEARLILGHDRPKHENDAEYYALCDAIVQKAWSRIRSAFNAGLQR